jgi:hypothetical protein
LLQEVQYAGALRYAMRMRDLVLPSLPLLLLFACGDEAAAVRGAWTVSKWASASETRIDCEGGGEVGDGQNIVRLEVESAGSMEWNDEPIDDAEHTFTRAMTKAPASGTPSGFIELDGEPVSVGWTPGSGVDGQPGLTVHDDDAIFGGAFFIVAAEGDAVQLRKTACSTFDGGAQFAQNDFFLRR